MAIIEEIGNKIITAGKKSSKAIADMSQVSKLKESINTEKRNVNQLYTTMGEVYFERYGRITKEDPFLSIGEQIQQSLDKIENFEEEIKLLQNAKTCPQCGATCEYTNSFCPSCGYAFPKIQQPDNDANRLCSNCGAPIVAGYDFCAECGTQMAATPVASASYTPPEPPAQPIPLQATPISPVSPANVPPAQEEMSDNVSSDVVMSCSNCGSELLSDAEFCVNCGHPIEQAEPSDGSPSGQAAVAEVAPETKKSKTSSKKKTEEVENSKNEEDVPPVIEENDNAEKKSEEVAAPDKSSLCANCGAELMDDAEFCIKCGTKIVS